VSPIARRGVVLADGLFLLVAGALGAAADVAGTFWGLGPTAALFIQLPAAGIGFLEAHGLAVIIGVMLLTTWRRPAQKQHVAAVCVHLLLGVSNLVFWDLAFVQFGLVLTGWVTTTLHFTFVALQLLAVPRPVLIPARAPH